MCVYAPYLFNVKCLRFCFEAVTFLAYRHFIPIGVNCYLVVPKRHVVCQTVGETKEHLIQYHSQRTGKGERERRR